MIADRHHRDDLLRVEIQRQRPLDDDAGFDPCPGLLDCLDFLREPRVERIWPDDVGGEEIVCFLPQLSAECGHSDHLRRVIASEAKQSRGNRSTTAAVDAGLLCRYASRNDGKHHPTRASMSRSISFTEAQPAVPIVKSKSEIMLRITARTPASPAIASP